MDNSGQKAYNRFLPYWAVFLADVHQLLLSWVYRFWVTVSLVALIGYLTYRMGPLHGHGIMQQAAQFVGDMMQWIVVGSCTLIVVLCSGAISSERGSLADSVLSRGISRYQYFLGKWHARLFTILTTYLVLSLAAMACGYFLLHENLQLTGCLMALATVAAILTAVISASVAVSAVVNSTLVGIAILWLFLYGGGLALSHFPERFPSVERTLQQLPFTLKGQFVHSKLWPIITLSCVISLFSALAGMIYFSRRDV